MDAGLGIQICKGWCHEPAEVVLNYNTSKGRQRVPLCSNCARIWWKGYKNAESGLSLSIEEV